MCNFLKKFKICSFNFIFIENCMRAPLGSTVKLFFFAYFWLSSTLGSKHRVSHYTTPPEQGGLEGPTVVASTHTHLYINSNTTLGRVLLRGLKKNSYRFNNVK